MKKSAFNLGSLFLTIVLFWISFYSNAQNSKLTRKEQKEARRAETIANFQALDSLLNRKSFVLEATYLENKYGDRIFVPAQLNFIRINSSDVVLQTGSNINTGYNGVGGITASGKLNNWKLIKNLNSLSYNLSFDVSTNLGIFNVSMLIGADNFARASITGLSNGELVYEGKLETIYNSRTYKGQQTY